MAAAPLDAAAESRLAALESAPLDRWIALSADESRLIADGDSFSAVSEAAAQRGEADPLIIRVPDNWTPRGPVALRFAYKIIPIAKSHPAFPDARSSWAPMLPVRLSVGHGAQTARFECLVDSGAADCLFHADLASALHLRLESGIRSPLSGIAANVALDAYYHDVNVWVGADRIRIRAAFAVNVPVAGLLGRRGFFDNFIVTFDPSNDPPGFDIQRLGHA